MKIIFLVPELTMEETKDAVEFYKECKAIFDIYITKIQYISSEYQINQLIVEDIKKDDILIFFNSEKGEYDEKILKLSSKYNSAQSRIWTIAMERNAECRRPPKTVSNKQSFDVYCRKENRNPLKNNIKAIAQIFARKVIAQTLSPLYRDEVQYFISHKRSDGEVLAAKLADELRLLTRERNVYRDVVNVEVGDDAQQEIDSNLKISDLVIFLQTKEAQYSKYIMKELCYALVNDIPILWIQIDNATYEHMEIRPGEGPILKYGSDEFYSQERLEEIVDEIEEKCFQLIMNSSNQVYSYIEYLNDMSTAEKIKLKKDNDFILAYEVEYREKTKDIYNSGKRKHYIQCYGRSPKEKDIHDFVDKVKRENKYDRNDKLFLLSNRGCQTNCIMDEKVVEENYDNYLINLENIVGEERIRRNKRIVLSGAFPDCDEIYKSSLIDALVVYAREIIKKGYILVFGAHPTFQKLIFDIGNLYASDIKYSIEMHMDKTYMDKYDLKKLEENCTLILSDNIQEMREKMMEKGRSELLICLGGKIKENKEEQGVDIEVELAKKNNIPVALVGTVGGRSSEFAYQKIIENNWNDLNKWDKSLNESLFYNVNHRLMVKRLLDVIDNSN